MNQTVYKDKLHSTKMSFYPRSHRLVIKRIEETGSIVHCSSASVYAAMVIVPMKTAGGNQLV